MPPTGRRGFEQDGGGGETPAQDAESIPDVMVGLAHGPPGSNAGHSVLPADSLLAFEQLGFLQVKSGHNLRLHVGMLLPSYLHTRALHAMYAWAR